jgi:hypothetical protein
LYPVKRSKKRNQKDKIKKRKPQRECQKDKIKKRMPER